MATICRLMSTNEVIPNQKISMGSSLTIGRNRECRIRDIKCSRSYCSVSFDGKQVIVNYLKNNSIENKANGDLITGPGFQYKIVIMALIDHQMNGSSLQQNNGLIKEHETEEEPNGEVFSYQNLVKPLISEPMVTTTEWQTLCLGRVHICRFRGGGKTSSLIAAFDFDGTLVVPKSGNKFPIDGNDWKLLDKGLPKRIEKYVNSGYRFVVISNQLGLSQGRMKLDDIKTRFEESLTAIGLPCLVFIAAYDDIYRKPRPGLWQLLTNESLNTQIDTTNSFFVGDAAGRKKQLNGKSDHSSADLLFAANNDIPFLTPERFANGIKPKKWDSTKKMFSNFNISTFHPMRIENLFIANKMGCDLNFKNVIELLNNYSGKLHTIIFCGLPASGKSSFYRNYLEVLNYCYVSRDELKTMEKCQKRVEKFLEKKQNCVVDNINVDIDSRRKWISLCKKFSSIPILFNFDVSVEQALHNNIFRRIIGVNSPVTDLVIRSQNKNFERPTVNEGFDAIYKINFVPKFQDKDNEKLYYMFLTER